MTYTASASYELFMARSHYIPFLLDVTTFPPFLLSKKLQKTRLSFLFPPSHTLKFLSTPELGGIEEFRFEGGYRYHDSVEEENVDSLACSLDASIVRLNLTGFAVRYLLQLKDNYFGDFTDISASRLDQPDFSPKDENAFDFTLGLRVQDLVVSVPGALYDMRQCIALKTRTFEVEMRYRPSMLTMQLDIAPIHLTRTIDAKLCLLNNPHLAFDSAYISRTFLYFVLMQDLTVNYLNFMGPNPLALPYATDWRFNFDTLFFDVSPAFLLCAMATFKSFQTTFLDQDNRLHAVEADLCVTAIQLLVSSVVVRVWCDTGCIVVELARGVLVQSDNFATKDWIDRVFVRVPRLCVQLLVKGSDTSGVWYEVARVSTSLVLSNYTRDGLAHSVSTLQKAYIQTHDASTKRCAWMYDDTPGKADDVFYLFSPAFNLIDGSADYEQSFFDLGERSPTNLDVLSSDSEQPLSDSDVNIPYKSYLNAYTLSTHTHAHPTAYTEPTFPKFKPTTHKEPQHTPNDLESSNDWVSDTPQNLECASKTLIVQFDSEVVVLFTPAAFECIQAFLTVVDREALSVEEGLDRLFLRVLDQDPTLKPSTTFLFAPKVHLHIIQDLERELPVDKVQELTSFDLVVKDLLFSSSLLSLKTTLANCEITQRILSSTVTGIPKQHVDALTGVGECPIVLDVIVKGLKVDASLGSVDDFSVSTMHCSVTAKTDASAYLVAAFLTMHSKTTTLLETIASILHKQTTTDLDLVQHILTNQPGSNHEDVWHAGFLSLTSEYWKMRDRVLVEESYLWRLLCHLRTLERLHPSGKLPVMQHCTFDRVVACLEAWRALRPDEVPFIKRFFRLETAESLVSSRLNVSAKVDSLVLVLYDLEHDDNAIQCDDLHFLYTHVPAEKTVVTVNIFNVTIDANLNLLFAAKHFITASTRLFASSSSSSSDPNLIATKMDIQLCLSNCSVTHQDKNQVSECICQNLKLFSQLNTNDRIFTASLLSFQLSVREKSCKQGTNEALGLADVGLKQVMVHANTVAEVDLKESLSVVVSLGSVDVLLPRSLLSLCAFMDAWITEALPQYHTLLDPLMQQHITASTPDVNRSLRLMIGRLDCEAQLLPSLCLKYNASQVLNQIKQCGQAYQFSIDTHSHAMLFRSSDTVLSRKQANASFSLPTFEVKGDSRFDTGLRVSSFDVRLGVIQLPMSSALVIQVLMSYTVVASELNDVVEMIVFNAQGTSSLSPRSVNTLNYSIAGIELSAESDIGLLSADVDDLAGSVKSDCDGMISFELATSALSLSFERTDKHLKLFDVVLDVEVRLCSFQDSGKKVTRVVLQIKDTRSIMHPAAAHELLAFAAFYSRQVAKEFAGKEKTTLRDETHRFIHSVPVSKVYDGASVDQLVILKEFSVELCISNFLVLFPLESVQERHEEDNPTLSLALYFDLFTVNIEKGESVKARIKGICVKFLDSFSIRIDTLLALRTSPSQNLLELQNVALKVSASDLFDSTKLSFVNAEFSIQGFTLYVDSQIASHGNTLVAVYETGKSKIATLLSSIDIYSPSKDSSQVLYTQEDSVKRFDLKCKFKFQDGLVKIFSTLKGLTVNEISDADDEYSTQNLCLPSLFMSLEGLTDFGRAHSQEPDKNRLLDIQLFVSETENTVHPSILMFINQILESTKKWQSRSTSSSGSLSHVSLSTTTDLSHQVNLVVSLSKTHINLSSQPIYKVITSLSLDRAMVFFSTTPCRRDAKFNGLTLRVDNLTFTLKHALSPERCLYAEVPFVYFNHGVDSVSSSATSNYDLYVPLINSSCSLRSLQDAFSFKYLWFDLNRLLNDNSAKMSVLQEIKSARATDRIHICCPVCQVEVDIGQFIGKVILKLDAVLFSLLLERVYGTKSSIVVDLGIKAISLAFSGKLNGNLLTESFRIHGNSASPTKTTPQPTLFDISLASITCDLSHQFEKILLMKVEDASFQIRDNWLFNLTSQLHLKLLTSVHVFHAIVSRRTATILVETTRKIATLVEEKQSAAKLGGLAFLTSAKNTYRSIDGLNDVFQRKLRKVLTFEGNTVEFTGSVELNVNQFDLTLTRNSVRDPEYAHIQSGNVFVLFTLSEQGRRKLTIKNALISVSKYNSKPISQSDERTWTRQQWFTFLAAQPSKKILTVPVSTTVMHTATVKRSVKFDFVSEFGGKIDVALNIGLYKYLQNLLEVYRHSVNSSEQAPEEEIAASVESTKLTSMGSVNAPDDKSSRPDRSSSPVKSLSPIKTDAHMRGLDAFKPDPTKLLEEIQFVREGVFKFDPQLKFTGDLSFDWAIDWLGVNKDNVPRMLHQNVTMHLSDLLERRVLGGYMEVYIHPTEDKAGS